MAAPEIPDRIKSFIYTHVDSIELLEVLLAFHKAAGQGWTAEALARELRSATPSIGKRIAFLESAGFLRRSAASSEAYIFQPATPELAEVVGELAVVYEIRRHKIFELIYSPMKKARDIADAFFLGEIRKDGRNDE